MVPIEATLVAPDLDLTVVISHAVVYEPGMRLELVSITGAGSLVLPDSRTTEMRAFADERPLFVQREHLYGEHGCSVATYDVLPLPASSELFTIDVTAVGQHRLSGTIIANALRRSRQLVDRDPSTRRSGQRLVSGRMRKAP